jgi:hypothetical protein
VVRVSDRIANAKAKFCIVNGGHGITRKIQVISLSNRVESAARSGRKAVTANSIAGFYASYTAVISTQMQRIPRVNQTVLNTQLAEQLHLRSRTSMDCARPRWRSWPC